MRMHEIEDLEDGAYYWASVFNPVGQFQFVLNEDRDFAEFVEHKVAAASVVGAVVYGGNLLSTGSTLPTLSFVDSYMLAHGIKSHAQKSLVGFLARTGMSLAGLTPAALALALAAGAGYALSEMYASLTPFEGIGDMSSWHTGYS
jgi:hypothetical protein